MKGIDKLLCWRKTIEIHKERGLLSHVVETRLMLSIKIGRRLSLKILFGPASKQDYMKKTTLTLSPVVHYMVIIPSEPFEGHLQACVQPGGGGEAGMISLTRCLSVLLGLQILRSMLYRGSEVMREVAWVVFDEIHYMRDAGVSNLPPTTHTHTLLLTIIGSTIVHSRRLVTV